MVRLVPAYLECLEQHLVCFKAALQSVNSWQFISYDFRNFNSYLDFHEVRHDFPEVRHDFHDFPHVEGF